MNAKNEIIPDLWIGDWMSARDAGPGFHVITVAVDDTGFTGQEKFPLVDGPGNDQALFNMAVAATCDAHARGSKVIVHCVGGRSRSAAVVTAAVARIKSASRHEAYDLLISKHPQTRIHPAVAALIK